MNLFWKRLLGRLVPTAKYEKQEIAFLTASERNKTLRYSSAVTEYKKHFLDVKFKSSEERKNIKSRLAELKRHPDVAFFLKNQSKKKGVFRDAFLTFSDDFFKRDTDKSLWNSGFYFQHEHLIRNYSFHNEQQANNAGQNTTLSGGMLKIHTRREVSKALAWHPIHGFAEKQFAYTSDIIQTGKTFRQQGGIFKAKIRCSGNIHHAFWLGTETKQPHINIFHFNGKEIQMGVVSQHAGDGITIKGIDTSKFHIYTLEWTKDALIWYINNLVVFRIQHAIPVESMFLVFNSFIPEKMNGEEGLLEVDWVRAYQFNP